MQCECCLLANPAPSGPSSCSSSAPPRRCCCRTCWCVRMSLDESMDEEELIINEDNDEHELTLQGEPVTGMPPMASLEPVAELLQGQAGEKPQEGVDDDHYELFSDDNTELSENKDDVLSEDKDDVLSEDKDEDLMMDAKTDEESEDPEQDLLIGDKEDFLSEGKVDDVSEADDSEAKDDDEGEAKDDDESEAKDQCDRDDKDDGQDFNKRCKVSHATLDGDFHGFSHVRIDDGHLEALRRFVLSETSELDFVEFKDSIHIQRIIQSTHGELTSPNASSVSNEGVSSVHGGGHSHRRLESKRKIVKRKHFGYEDEYNAEDRLLEQRGKWGTVTGTSHLEEGSNGTNSKSVEQNFKKMNKKRQHQQYQQQYKVLKQTSGEAYGSTFQRTSLETCPPAKRQRLETVEKRETSRHWTPSNMIFKPLQQGWVREVVYKQFEDGSFDYGEPPDIIYYAPSIHGGSKRRAFTSVQELSQFLVNDSSLSWHNFSFRREPMRAKQEVIRGEHQPSVIAISNQRPAGIPEKGVSKKMQRTELKQQKRLAVGSSKTSSCPKDNGLKLRPASALLANSLNKSIVVTSVKKTKKKPALLRPRTNRDVNCSIHCPGVTGFPSLSCISCHGMFHPFCVGLQDDLNDNDEDGNRDFLCSKCDAKNVSNDTDETRVSRDEDVALEHNNGDKFGDQISRQMTNGGGSHLKSKAKATVLTPAMARTASENSERRRPLIDGQTMVMIGGMKFLVVPHNKGTNSSTFRNSKNVSSASKKESEGPNILNLLLRPTKENNSLPCFKVEETSDGKLLLLPTNDQGQSKNVGNPFKSKTSTMHSTPSQESLITSVSLSSSYFALLHIFKYLPLSDRVRASRVCKLWRDVLKHPSLNQTIDVSSFNVSSWPGFLHFVSQSRVNRLDLRRLLVNKDATTANDTWSEATKALHELRPHVFATHIDLPRIDGNSLSALLQDLPFVLCLTAVMTTVQKTTAKTATAINFEALRLQPRLQELRLKFVSNSTILETCQPLAHLRHLRTLSLLNCSGFRLTDVEVIGSMLTLEELELGDNCPLSEEDNDGNQLSSSVFSTTLFHSIMRLKRLRSFRMERGLCNSSVGELRWLPHLEKLELVDVELKEGFGDGLVRLQTLTRLLLIPKYKDEAASINGEMVDAAMSMSKLSTFYLGVTNEWLDEVRSETTDNDNSETNSGKTNKVPIIVDGICELYSLSKLLKTLTSALSRDCKVKVLKMAQHSTRKQFLDNRK